MTKSIFSYKVILIDLDNTIINEIDYLFQGYKTICLKVEEDFKIPTEETLCYLKETFEISGRKNLFNKFLEHFDLPFSILPTFLKTLRTFKPTSLLELNPNMLVLMKTLEEHRIEFFIVTNGNPIQQKNKVHHTNWQNLNPKIIYANEYNPKPSPESFNVLKENFSLSVKPFEVLMIGDSDIDKQYAFNIGCDFLNINDIRNQQDG